jgi:hypothetical protein
MTLTAAPPLLGSITPRLWTPPLRELTPETSYGFEVIDFARDTLEHPLLPWQEFAVIHGGELLPDGRPRFRIVLLLVSRQNGKTELPVVLSVYWQFRKKVPLTLGTSTKLAYAKESWQKALNLVKRTRAFDDLHEPGRKWYRRTNGETESWTLADARYLIAASNDEGGRSLTINRGVADELRQHHDYSAWDAFEPACSPWDAQIWALSNAGSLRSLVLNDLQDSAREFIETGEGDRRLGLFEWSAPEDSDPEDVDALLAANPRVGYGLDLEVLLAAAARAKRLGGEALTGFKTERMCIRVMVLNPAIEPALWREGAGAPESFEDLRGKVALVADVAPSMQSASLYAAAVQPDGRVRVGPVEAWNGPQATEEMRRALPRLVAGIKPRAFGWLPSGPSAALAADLKDRTAAGRRGEWPPRGVAVEEIRGELAAVCTGFAEQVVTGRIWHTDDPRLNDQVATAEWLNRGDTKVFSRKGEGDCDAIYAAAGAVHLARTLPTGLGKPRILLPTVRDS